MRWLGLPGQVSASLLLQLSRVFQSAALLIFVLLFDLMCKLLHAVVLLTRMLQLVNLSEHNCCDDNAHFVQFYCCICNFVRLCWCVDSQTSGNIGAKNSSRPTVDLVWVTPCVRRSWARHDLFHTCYKCSVKCLGGR